MSDTTPHDLKAALTTAGALAAFESLSLSHRREHINAIEEAKKPETRAHRIEACIKMVKAKSEQKGAKQKIRKAAD